MRYRQIVTVIAIFFELCIPAVAQFRSMMFGRFTIENGLSNNSINNIIQTKDGFLWIATKDGLNRYDGQSFKHYKHDPSQKKSLPENYVNSLLESSDGTLLVGTWGGGLCLYNNHQETFTRIDGAESADDYIQCMFEDSKGFIWFGTVNGGLNKLDLKTQKIISYRKNFPNSRPFPSNNIMCIVEDDKKNLWVGTGDAGLLKFNYETQTILQFTNQPSDNNTISNNIVLSIFNDRNIGFWVGTQSGFDRFDVALQRWNHFPEIPKKVQPLLTTPVSQILKDRLGRLWVGTYEYAGLFLVEDVGTASPQVLHLRRENDNLTSIISDRIRWLYEDRQNNIWVGTEDGLAKLPVTQPFYQYRHLPLRPTSLHGRVISSIYEGVNEMLWVGLGGNGLDQIDLRNKTITHHTQDSKNSANTLSNNVITSIYEDQDGILWIGTTGGGLNKFHPKANRMEHYFHNEHDTTSLRNNWVQQVLETTQEELLVASEGGLQIFDRKRETFKIYLPDIINGITLPKTFSPNALFEDRDGTLWIGTWLDGLFRYNPKTKILNQYMPDGNDPSSISSSKITAITEDSHGYIWLGTHSGGFNKFDKVTGKFHRYSMFNGLPNDVVFGILEDDHGFLWISTMNGLAKFNPNTETFRVYDESDGIVHNQFNWRAYYKNKKRVMYFGGINGFVSFHPDSIKIDSVPPIVAITSFKIFDKEASLQQSLTETKEIILNHDENFFSIEFTVLDLAPLHKHQFEYMLEGVDPQWVNSGIRRTAFYTNIQQGTYSFLVKASNTDGVWGQPIVLKIVILPAWWMTWWFKLLVLVFLLSGGILIYEYRVNQLLEIERIRFNIASDLHDEIGSNLSSISVDSQMLMQSKVFTEKERELSSDISRTAKETVEAIRDIIWFINPKHDIGEDIIFKMKETASKILVGIHWTFDVSPDIRFDTFDLEVRRHIFLIYKETLTNVVRHSKATQCSIEAAKNGNHVRIVIQDNGVGFNVQSVKKNNGLANIYHRAEKIQATIVLTSEEEKGTRLELSISTKNI
ncbi:MAG: two-component regulator propeller domain-containing protein [Bacteroidota bacterium]|nr:two-component regulator propeller domain-containing protein [Bacteroidota bacterium]